MITEKIVKKELEKIIEEKEKNLIRLRFDLYYAGKIYRDLMNNREEYDNKKKRCADIADEIAKDKNMSKKLRDKEKIIKLEDEKNVLVSEIGAYEKEISQAQGDEKERGILVNKTEQLIDSVKKSLEDKKLVKFLSDYGKPNTTK